MPGNVMDLIIKAERAAMKKKEADIIDAMIAADERSQIEGETPSQTESQ